MSANRFRRDALWMRENLKAVVAGDADEGDARRVGYADGESGWCGDSDQDRRSHPDGFLNEFDGDPAGENHNPRGGIDGGARQGTCELVERVVTTDVLAQRDQSTIECPKASCVQRARFGIQFLRRGQRGNGGLDLDGAHLQARCHSAERRQRLGKTFDPAQATARRTQHGAAANGKAMAGARRHPHPEFDAGVLFHDVQGGDLGRVRNLAF